MNKVISIIQNRLLQHSLFWMLSFYIFIRIVVRQEEVYTIDLIYASLFHISLIIAVYSHLYLLIPKLLSQKKYILYTLSLVTLIIICSSLNHWFVDRLGRIFFEEYYFISDYTILEVAQFTVAYLAISTLLQWSKSWFDIKEKERKISLLEKEKLDMELQALKAQINPHFLFNSMNNIYSLALDQDKKTPQLILGLSKCLRYMLYECKAEKVPLEKEINYITDYIELQKMRLTNPEVVTFELKGSLQQQQIAPLLLIPILENGFKHGVKGDIDQAYLNIEMTIEPQTLLFYSKNNKGEAPKLTSHPYKGLGLGNLRKQLKLLYPQKHQFQIEETESDFSLFLKLDLS